ncbi:MAG: fasciclin domain-containing protein [Planctomycetia bacterium]|nr:fasciclin domain-containing protein [Planctomycetia bacterium]
MTTTEKCTTGHCLGKWTALTLVIVLALAVVGWATLEQRKNILKTAEGMESCSTFVECVRKAGLANVLEKDGPFSVFAPTDEAFSKIGKEQLTQLLDNKSALTALLLYHLVPRAMNVDEMNNIEDCMTCTVPQTAIPCSQHTYGKAKLIRSAVPCTNGVIYVIDSVQVPPFMAGEDDTLDATELTVIETLTPENTTSAAENKSSGTGTVLQKGAAEKADSSQNTTAGADTEKGSVERVGEKIDNQVERVEGALKRGAEKVEEYFNPSSEPVEPKPSETAQPNP